jgi:hypothetical protein
VPTVVVQPPTAKTRMTMTLATMMGTAKRKTQVVDGRVHPS